jgi:hypothetical protein
MEIRVILGTSGLPHGSRLPLLTGGATALAALLQSLLLLAWHISDVDVDSDGRTVVEVAAQLV